MPDDDNLPWPSDLIAKYPLTFRRLQDFSCGPGWRELLTELCDVIELFIASLPGDDLRPYAIQVKEKFGSLRFHVSGFVPEIELAISAAEKRSSKTCEQCGAPGVLDSDSPHGWVTVRCSSCRKASKASQPPQP